MLVEKIQKNTIALCMIVKNEEKNIERCLKSVEGIVDEIVIIDTGSTDSTQEIAKKYATTFLEEEWNDNFSYVRNLSIKNAKSDWILVLDADEELDETTKTNIFDAIKYDNVIANFLYIRNLFPHFNLQVLQPRLFRNHKDLFYEKPVVENILNSIKEITQKEKNLLVKNAPVYINHIGYLEEEELFRKFIRNAKHIENVLIDFSISNTERIYYLIKLINTYKLISKDHEKTISLITHTFNLMKEENYKDTPSESEMLIISTNIIDYLLKINNLERAEEIINNTLNQYPDSLNMLYLSAITKMNLKKQYAGIEDFIKILNLIETDTYYKYEPIMLENLKTNTEKYLKSFPNENNEIEKIKAKLFKTKNTKKNDEILIESIYTGTKIDPKDEFPSGPIDLSKLVTICVIAKNKEDKLDLPLGEIYDSVDEIIVIDLTDDPEEKIVKEAEKYNAHVFSYTWDDDFSRIKNYALSYASSQWIIFLDTNEFLGKKNFQKLLEHLNNPKLAGIYTNILEYKENKFENIRHEYKIFRNIPAIRYMGNVYESIDFVLINHANKNELLLLNDSEIEIKHFLSDSKDEIKLKLDLLYKVLSSTINPIEKMFSLLNISKLSKELGNKESAFRSLLNAYDATQAIEPSILTKLPFLSELYLEILGYLDFLGKNDLGKNMSLELIKDVNNSTNYKFFYYAGKFTYNLEFSDELILVEEHKAKDRELVKSMLLHSLNCIYKNSFYNKYGETVSVKKDKEEMNKILEKISESNTSRSKISFCMIAKNEEKYLERCLNSVKDFVDEIIIVDTGSTDNTKEIAKNFNAKIFDFVWENDFSKARNFSLEKCSFPWILTLDADEVLDEKTTHFIKTMTLNSDVIAYTVARKDLFEKEEKNSQLYRFFQNIPEIKYELPIYESIVKSVKNIVNDKVYKVESSNLIINHYGYTSDLENSKHKRNIKIISDTLKNLELENDSKALLETKLAVLYKVYENNLDKSLSLTLNILDSIENWSNEKKYEYGFILELYNNLIDIYKIKNEIENALKYALKGLEIYPNSLTLNYNYSFILYLKKDYEECIESFHKCIKLAQKDSFYKLDYYNMGIVSYLALYGIGSCYLAMNNFNIAKIFFEQALEANPDYEPAKKSLELILA